MVYSVIDIGSTAVFLKIVSSNRRQVHVIDEVATEIEIGREVYSTEYISRSSVIALVDILHSYARLMKDYRVDFHRIIAAGAIQNAKNASQVIEIVRMKTGFEIEILDSPVENYITYKALKDKMQDYQGFRQGAVIVDTHSGSTDITVYSKGRLISNDTIKLGSQIAVPYIEKVIAMVSDYPQTILDYVSTLTRRAQKKVINRNVHSLVLLGNSASALSRLYFDGRKEIGAEEFEELHKKVMRKEYDPEKKAGEKWEMMLFTIILCGIFLDASDAEIIRIPEVSLSDGVLSEIIDREQQGNSDLSSNSHSNPKAYSSRWYEEDIFDAATEIARRFKCKLRHIRNMESNTRILFDALYERLDMDRRDGFTLRLAVHLSEIGKSLRRSGYERATCDMLRHLDIFGVSRAMMEEVGCIALELENIFSSDVNRIIHTIRTRKIAILLAIGMALDIDNLQQIKVVSVDADEECISITVAGEHFVSSRIALEPVREAFADCLGYELLMVEDVCC